MTLRVWADRRRSEESGFTVVEIVVALGITAIAFTALAALLLTSLKALAIQKARTQGNEIATQGIEDLQRLRYNNLGLCGTPSAPVPADLGDTVMLPNCSGAVRYAPCGGTPVEGAVPAEEYTCTRVGIAFKVRRFVAYGDIAHTQKRLAVFVKWTDSVGDHEVSQQSSLRIPNRSAVIGVAPPSIQALSSTINPSTVTLGSGDVTSSDILVTARTDGLEAPPAGDAVVVAYPVLQGGQPVQLTTPLTTSDGTNWSAVIPTGTALARGDQYVTLTAIRRKDGKVGSLVIQDTLNTVPNSEPTRAQITDACVVTISPPACDPSPASIKIDGSGALKSPTTSFSVAVRTMNVSPQDSMQMIFNTQTGAVTIALEPDTFLGGACDLSTCTTTWRATVDQGAGYLFIPGPQRLFFNAVQGKGPNPVDIGTTSSKSVAVEFSS